MSDNDDHRSFLVFPLLVFCGLAAVLLGAGAITRDPHALIVGAGSAVCALVLVPLHIRNQRKD